MTNAKKDDNGIPVLLGVSNVDGVTPVMVYVDPVTHRLLVDLAGGSGTVTSVSVVSANGFAGTVATSTTTPAITLTTSITGVLKGNGTAISAASDGTDYLSPTTGFKLNQTSPQTVTGTPQFPSLDIIGTAGAGYQKFVAQSVNPTAPAAGTALLHAATTQGFTRMELDNEAATNIVLARDLVAVAKNTSGVTINKGEVVYVSGSTGNVPNIAKAQANSSTTLPSVFVAIDNIADNAFGQVMRHGILSSIDTSAFSSGDEVYLSATVAGGLTATRPSGTTNFVQRIGTVLVSGIGNGSIDIAVAPAIQNMETGTNAATWTGTNGVFGGTLQVTGHTTFEGVTSTGATGTGKLVYDTSPTLVTPLLGTPTSGTLTNCTGLPVAGITPSTSTALGVGSIELGHASDTTISRSSAGVIAVEGIVIPSISSTNTLTNKRVTKRTGTTTSSATPTINTDNVDFYSITAQTEAITSFTTNLSGTPTEAQTLWLAITGTAARAITWGTSFEASTIALPTTTVSTNRLDVLFVWNTVSSKWRCVASV